MTGCMKLLRERLRSHLTYANAMATIAVFIALGGAAMAAVVVNSNSQVAKDTISGHKPPSGKHANVIAGSVSGSDLSTGIKASLTLHCPAGLSRAADICFENPMRDGATLAEAIKACAVDQRRLPSAGELAQHSSTSVCPRIISGSGRSTSTATGRVLRTWVPWWRRTRLASSISELTPLISSTPTAA
jgi:hypothetical protein